MPINLKSVWFLFCIATTFVVVSPQESRAETQAQIDEFLTPGPQHEFLKKFEGNWRAVVHFRATAQAPEEQTENAAQAAMIMDGRYLDKTITNSDGTFHIRITYGFDNYRKEFSIVWIDNMCTGMITSTGQYNPQTGSLDETGLMSSPFTAEPRRWFRAVTAFKDSDHYTYEMFKKDDDGEEFRSMLIEFTRIP